jgi:hypothetical protein
MKNKKNMTDLIKQKKYKTWKKVPPTDGEKYKKKHNKRTFYWCKHHMAWTMHSPKECCLGKEWKGENVLPLPPLPLPQSTGAIKPFSPPLAHLRR